MLHNIVTIYRFNTPFLNIENEKNRLIEIKKKISDFMKTDLGEGKEDSEEKGNYMKFKFDWNLVKISFSYIKNFDGNYYLPIFKMNLYVDNSFMMTNEKRKSLVNFLTSLFENFDGINEKEYLIDIDKSIYYDYGLLGKNKYPVHQFSDIFKIQNDFEKGKGEKILEEFINTYKTGDFVLTKENAKIYHKIHSIILYYIYLVYIMYKNIEKSTESLKDLENTGFEEIVFESQKDLIQKRLSYVQELNIANFKAYYTKLETLFSLLK